MAKTYTYETVKEYINKNNCKLLTTEEEYLELKEAHKTSNKIILKIQCECGNEFYVSIIRFRHNNKRTCNECSQKRREKSKRKTIHEIKEIIKSHNNGCELLEEEYINTKTKMKFKCNCGNVFTTSWENYLYKKVRCCDECTKDNRKSKTNIKWDTESVSNIIKESGCELLSEYKNYNSLLDIRCKCGNEFKVNFNNFYRGNQRQCCECGHKSGTEKQKYTLEQIKNKIKVNNEDLILLSKEYKNCKQKLKFKCKKCGEIFYRNWDEMNNCNVYNCPICKMSKGEQKVFDYLKSINSKFDREYCFDDLLSENGYYLRYDFVVFNKSNIQYLIEYDGIYHYEPVITEEHLKLQQKRDEIKNTYCKDNNIKLIRIPYWEFDNIECILKDILINKNIKNEFILI